MTQQERKADDLSTPHNGANQRQEQTGEPQETGTRTQTKEHPHGAA